MDNFLDLSRRLLYGLFQLEYTYHNVYTFLRIPVIRTIIQCMHTVLPRIVPLVRYLFRKVKCGCSILGEGLNKGDNKFRLEMAKFVKLFIRKYYIFMLLTLERSGGLPAFCFHFFSL